ncbi:hypothetical protein ACROYT_G020268 [Oculina patagonica]
MRLLDGPSAVTRTGSASGFKALTEDQLLKHHRITVEIEVTGSFCNIRKFVGSQLRSTSYRVKTFDCYRIPSEVVDYRPSAISDDADSSSDEAPPAQPVPSPPSPPVIPSAISTPAAQNVANAREDTHPDPAIDSDSDTVEASADNGQVELRGDLESREHELEELKEPTDEASANDGKAERRGDLESREHELEELEEPTGKRHLYKLAARWCQHNFRA